MLLPDPEHGSVLEVIDPGVVSDEVLRGDVICNINHDDDKMLGRCTDGKGSLRLTRDDHGVQMSIYAGGGRSPGQRRYHVQGDIEECGGA